MQTFGTRCIRIGSSALPHFGLRTGLGTQKNPIHGEGEGEEVHRGGGDVAGGGRRSPPPPRNQSGSRPPSNLLLWLLSRDPRWASRPRTPPSCSLFAGSGTKLSPGKEKVLENV